MNFLLYIYFIFFLNISLGLTLFDSKIICFLNSACEDDVTIKNKTSVSLFSQLEGLILDESYLLENEKKRKNEVFRDRWSRVIQLINEKLVQEKHDFECVYILNELKKNLLNRQIRDEK